MDWKENIYDKNKTLLLVIFKPNKIILFEDLYENPHSI